MVADLFREDHMNLSSGDWIAIILSAGAMTRWIIDGARQWMDNQAADGKSERAEINEIRRDMDIHIALCEQQGEWLKETLGRLEGAIAGLQRQMGKVSTGTPDHIYELGRRDKETGG